MIELRLTHALKQHSNIIDPGTCLMFCASTRCLLGGFIEAWLRGTSHLCERTGLKKLLTS